MTAKMTEQVMVRMRPEMIAAVRADAVKEGRTMAQTIRLAIKRHLEQRTS